MYLKGAHLEAFYMKIKLKYTCETVVTLPRVLCAGHYAYDVTCHRVCLTAIIIQHFKEREAKVKTD